MAAPRLQIQVLEPKESGALVYAPMAAPASGTEELGRLALVVAIGTFESGPVQMKSLRVELRGPGAYHELVFPLDFVVQPGALAWWHPKTAYESLFFSLFSPPTEAKLEFRAVGFSDPMVLDFQLRPHRHATTSGSYLFPARASDLGAEYWSKAGPHAPAGYGQQLFAHDLGIRDRFGRWVRPGASGTQNEDALAWGKRVQAMADGEVVHALNDVPDNPHPLPGPDWDAELAKQRDEVWGGWADRGGDGGNHVHIQHGTEVVLYLHLRRGSVPERLLEVGAPVAAGEFLGRVGNSGNSSGPHLHVHAVRGTNARDGWPRPLVFAPISVVSPHLTEWAPVPWTQVVTGRTLPFGATSIWPSAPPPYGHADPAPPPEVGLVEYAIDRLSLLLSNDMYVKLKLPRPPEPGLVLKFAEQILEQASPSERQKLLARLGAAAQALSSLALGIEQMED